MTRETPTGITVKMQDILHALTIWQKIMERGLREFDYDLSSRQLGILLSVYTSPPPHTVKSLSERLGISKPAVCRALDTLSRENMLRRIKDPDDKRNVFITRTVKGSVYLSEFGEIQTRLNKRSL